MSSFSEGQTHQLMEKLESEWLTPNDVTLLGQFNNWRGIRDVVLGVAEIAYPERRWREEDGVIHFSVTRDGTTGEEWITRLERQGNRLSEYAKSVLLSPEFKPSSGLTTVGVFKGSLFADRERVTRSIRVHAKCRNWNAPSAEVACLIREMFSDEEIESMGLWAIIAMHEPIEDSDGNPRLLGALRGGGGRWLDAFWDSSDGRWNRGYGFAFSLAS